MIQACLTDFVQASRSQVIIGNQPVTGVKQGRNKFGCKKQFRSKLSGVGLLELMP